MEIGKYVHKMTFQNPTVVADGYGGTTTTWADLTPAEVWVSIEPATARSLERVAGGAAVVSSATHIVTGRYHAGVTTKTRGVFRSRIFQVLGVANLEERNRTMVVTCQELVA